MRALKTGEGVQVMVLRGMRLMSWRKLFLCLLQLALAIGAPAETRRVAFVGDSITHDGRYIGNLRLFNALAHPESAVDYCNVGICGDDTARALSRWDDVEKTKATDIVIALGMNDIRKHLYSAGAKAEADRAADLRVYESSLRSLTQKAKRTADRICLMTPTPYDEYGTWQAEVCLKDADAVGLTAVAEIVRRIASEEGVSYIDVHGPFADVLKQHPDVRIGGADRIHPVGAGHLLTASLFLRASGETSSVERIVRTASQGLSFRHQPKRLPFPRTADFIELSKAWPDVGSLSAEILSVRELPRGRYRLLADGRELGVFDSDALAEGVNLSKLNTPSMIQALKVSDLSTELTEIDSGLQYLALVDAQVAKYGSAEKWCEAFAKDGCIASYRGWADFWKKNKAKESEWRHRLSRAHELLVTASRPGAYALELQLVDESRGRVVQTLNDGWRSRLVPEKGKERFVNDVTLPHNWDDYYGFRQQFHGNLHGTATYVRTFCAAPRSGGRSYLVFEGAGSYLTVKLNGKEVCRRKPSGRLVSTLEVTDAIRRGENLLEVVCEHPSEIKDLPWICGGCSGCQCESPEPIGLFRDVSLVTTGPARIIPYGLHVWSDEACKTCYVESEIDFGSSDGSGLTLHLHAPELGIDETVSPGGAGRVLRTYPLKDVRRWSVGKPELYTVTAELKDAVGLVVDSESVRTGFRSIRWPFHGEDDHRFFLNGVPTFVHGTAEVDHRLGGSMAFEPEEIAARIADIRRLGFNLFREGHEPHDRRFGELLEENGMMWWPGLSTHAYFDTPEFRANFLAAVEQWVRERRNSPAVVIWGLQNESTLPKEFAEECVRLIRRLDPTTCQAGRQVVTCNWGAGTDWNVFQNWTGTYAGMGGTLMTYEKDLAKPDQLLNGEYGAWRSAGFHTDPDAPWDIKGPWSEEHAARILYEKLMRGWKARDRVAGQCLWIWMSHENPGRDCRVEEGYREIDKLGPVNFKGLYTIWGQRTAAWYLYYAYGRHLAAGTLDGVLEKPLSWWIAEGKRMSEPGVAPRVVPTTPAGYTCIRRFNCGGDSLTDSCGNVWQADDSRFVKSWAQDEDLAVEDFSFNPVMASQTEVAGDLKNVTEADAAIFRTMRYGRRRLRFDFPAPTNADCRVEMYFVEPGSYGRSFDIAINGRTVERDFQLGRLVPERNVVCRSWAARGDAEGRLSITFPRVAANQAVVSAIAIYAKNPSGSSVPKDVGEPGYPESDGMTWRELTARVRHKTPARLLPFQGKIGVGVPPSLAMPDSDKDGWHRAKFCLYTAANYAIRFRVIGGDPHGKKLTWRFVDASYKWQVAEGELDVENVTEDGFVVLPIGSYINAGYYAIMFKADGFEVSPREMVWK